MPEVLPGKDSYAHPRSIPQNLRNRRNLRFQLMISRIVLILLLAAAAQAQGATEVQGAQIKGTVILNGASAGGIEGMQEAAYTG